MSDITTVKILEKAQSKGTYGMSRKFPRIEKLEDVLPSIKDRMEFSVLERPDHTIIQYNVVLPDTFPNLSDNDSYIRRECRGVAFDKNGRVLSRKYHKFFNVNEREETLASNIDWSEDHVILEKLDGSMISPFHIDGHIHWATKRGITDFSDQVKRFVDSNPQYERFSWDLYNDGFTPIYEWCSRENRVIIDHPESRLVLTAIRDTVSGRYTPYEEMVALSIDHGIDCVKTVERSMSLDALIKQVHDLEFDEGRVVRFESGEMIKIKSLWYVTISRAMDGLTHEKDVIRLLASGQADDVVGMLPPVLLDRFKRYEKDFWDGLRWFEDGEFQKMRILLDAHDDPKQIALDPRIKNLSPVLKSYLFDLARSKRPLTSDGVGIVICDYLTKHCNSSTMVERLRHMHNPNPWNSYK